MAKKTFTKGNTGQLKPAVKAYLQAYKTAITKIAEGRRRGFGEDAEADNGSAESRENLSKANDELVRQAIKLFGPNNASERSFSLLAEWIGQEFAAGDYDIDKGVTKLIDVLIDEGNASFDVILPNYLILFKDGVRSLTIGRVQTALTADIAPKLMEHISTLKIVHGERFSQTTSEDGVAVTMPPVCWVVKVDAVQDNAQEEAKWLVDVAISLLRMSYTSVGSMFPKVGDIEPHPWEPWNLPAGLTTGPQVVYVGKRPTRNLYEVNKEVETTIGDHSFADRADLILDPKPGTLAERINRGLGWLARGRQTKDRAERLLYNFTAIEALLSSTEKSAPVTQTIARNAGVIITDDVAVRAKISKDIIDLYDFRSQVVHAGSRPVSWTQSNFAQDLAEDLFWRVLPAVNLSMEYTAFLKQLSFASYGSPWPPLETPSEGEAEAGKPGIGQPAH